MKVLYYIPNLTRYNGGIFQYACALLRTFGQDKKNLYYVLHNSLDHLVLNIIDEYPNLIIIPTYIGKEKKIEKIINLTVKGLKLIATKNNIKVKWPIFSVVERLCKRYKIDVVYCPYQDIPATSRKTISTLHDVQEIHFPEFFTPKERLHRAILHKKITENSSLIIVSYNHIKNDLITYFCRNDQNVLVCLLSMENLWFDTLSDEDLVDLNTFGISKEFILYPAATWPHKNHINLLKALSFIKEEKGIIVNAVFTGHKNEYYSFINEEAKRLNVEQQVNFIGVVDEKVLFSLYRSAKAVVIPTLYEAGSFPLMESIMMNVPVICSNVTSLPDTIGDDKFVFNPSSHSEMADKILKILFNDNFIQKNKENNIKQTAKLRNTNALTIIQKAVEVLRQI